MKNKIAQPVPAVLVGLCPLLAVCADAWTGLCLGLLMLAVYLLTNLCVSLIAGTFPDVFQTKYLRVLVLSAVAAGWSVLTALLLEAFASVLFAQFGAYLYLIVVFCVLLDVSGVSDAWESLPGAEKIGPGALFLLTLVVLGLVREFFGAGTLFNITVLPSDFTPVGIFTRIPGAFLTAALILIAYNVWHGRDGKEDLS